MMFCSKYPFEEYRRPAANGTGIEESGEVSERREVAAGKGRMVISPVLLKSLNISIRCHLVQGEEIVRIPEGRKCLSDRSYPCRGVLACKGTIGSGQGSLNI